MLGQGRDRGIDRSIAGVLDLDPFEQHRQLMDVDRDARYTLGDAGREREHPALEALVNDRESAARPQDQLDLVPAPIEDPLDYTRSRTLRTFSH
ncbi:MAG TPA: hypothetical protein VFK02_31995, partial [Kofleriaceae bacterium]|nr:hypothetical protein [Kofleriaceae bacterium]